MSCSSVNPGIQKAQTSSPNTFPDAEEEASPGAVQSLENLCAGVICREYARKNPTKHISTALDLSKHPIFRNLVDFYDRDKEFRKVTLLLCSKNRTTLEFSKVSLDKTTVEDLRKWTRVNYNSINANHQDRNKRKLLGKSGCHISRPESPGLHLGGGKTLSDLGFLPQQTVYLNYVPQLILFLSPYDGPNWGLGPPSF